ncbi:MAG: hypothetical protein WAL47_09910 [Pyrinomonadaceae bacterium]
MSDYLTNLVMRSFSPMAAVKPMGASFYGQPPEFERSGGEVSDPFAEAASSANGEGAEGNEQTSQRKLSRAKPEASLTDPSDRENQTSSASFADNPSKESLPLRHEFPEREELETVRRRSHPPLADESRVKPDTARRKPEDSALRITGVSLTPAEKPAEPTMPPARKKESGDTRVVNRETKPVPKQTPEVTSEISPYVGSTLEGTINPSTPVAKPLDSGVSTWNFLKKPGSLSPQTSPAHLTSPIATRGDKLQSPGFIGNVVERTTVASSERQETTDSLTTLIPKISAQPPLHVSINAQQNSNFRQVTQDTAQLPLTETIVNVAIGRIEVRATPIESAKRERQSKGPKVMNLDDYMQQRSRGKR